MTGQLKFWHSQDLNLIQASDSENLSGMELSSDGVINWYTGMFDLYNLWLGFHFVWYFSIFTGWIHRVERKSWSKSNWMMFQMIYQWHIIYPTYTLHVQIYQYSGLQNQYKKHVLFALLNKKTGNSKKRQCCFFF